MPSPQNLTSIFEKPLKEVSGHYNNTQFGITDILFPDGWHGREVAAGALTVIMHPGKDNQSSLFGLALSIPFWQHKMILQVLNNSNSAASSSEKGILQTLSTTDVCKQLSQNSTSIINGRTFHVATVECPLRFLDSNAVLQTKLYEFRTTDKTYRLGLFLTPPLNLKSASQISEKPDISKYARLLDATANTLKFR
jgi:hypothetical protein